MFILKTPIASLMFYFFHQVDLHPHTFALIFSNCKTLHQMKNMLNNKGK